MQSVASSEWIDPHHRNEPVNELDLSRRVIVTGDFGQSEDRGALPREETGGC